MNDLPERDSFEVSRYYFCGESTEQRIQNWHVWKDAYAAACADMSDLFSALNNIMSVDCHAASSPPEESDRIWENARKALEAHQPRFVKKGCPPW